MKYKMHRNDANKFLQSLVDQGKWDEFREVEIEYIPLDLSAYPQLKPETAKWINILFKEETTDRNGNYMLRGFTYTSAKEKELLNCKYGDAGCDTASYYAYNDEELILFTYCEGDTTCTLFSDKAKYLEEKAETEKWYREER